MAADCSHGTAIKLGRLVLTLLELASHRLASTCADESGAGPLFRTRPTSSVPSDGTVADILDARARRREA